MVAVKKPTVKKVAVKAPPKPKFGEVGFEFPVIARITEVNPEENEYDYPFVIKINMGNYEDFCNDGQSMEFSYGNTSSFKEFHAKCDPKFVKIQKQEELKQAQALVAKLTKEIAAIK